MSRRTGSILVSSTEHAAPAPPSGSWSIDPHAPRYVATMANAMERPTLARITASNRHRCTDGSEWRPTIGSWLLRARDERFETRRMRARRVRFDEAPSEGDRARAVRCISIAQESLHLEHRCFGAEKRRREIGVVLGECVQGRRIIAGHQPLLHSVE